MKKLFLLFVLCLCGCDCSSTNKMYEKESICKNNEGIEYICAESIKHRVHYNFDQNKFIGEKHD